MTGTVVVAPAAARQVSTIQLHALGTFAEESALGVGAGAGVGGAGRVGGGVAFTLLRYRESLALRGELAVTVHLDPGRRRGVSPYIAAGAAFLETSGGAEEYLVVTVGLEAAPRDRRRWFVEVGVGGGVRTAVGLRLRPPFR